MAEPYMPTDDEVSTCYHEFAEYLVKSGDTSFPPEFGDWKVGLAAYQRWIAKHDAEVSARALWKAARVIRDSLDVNKVSRLQQDRMKYAIGFLEASADEYKEIRS